MISCILGFYLFCMGVIDWKKKSIPVVPGIACIISVVLIQIISGTKLVGWLPGILLGLILFGVSVVTKGAIGCGDALVYTAIGLSVGFFCGLEILTISLILASIFSIALMIVKKVGRKYEIPFIPFTFLSYGLVVFL